MDVEGKNEAMKGRGKRKGRKGKEGEWKEGRRKGLCRREEKE